MYVPVRDDANTAKVDWVFVIQFFQLVGGSPTVVTAGLGVEAQILHPRCFPLAVLCYRECRIPARDPDPTLKASPLL